MGVFFWTKNGTFLIMMTSQSRDNVDLKKIHLFYGNLQKIIFHVSHHTRLQHVYFSHKVVHSEMSGSIIYVQMTIQNLPAYILCPGLFLCVFTVFAVTFVPFTRFRCGKKLLLDIIRLMALDQLWLLELFSGALARARITTTKPSGWLTENNSCQTGIVKVVSKENIPSSGKVIKTRT